ncbi:hypothetical protein Ciccas_012368 [Cichlidogyrus casuarinus]|uniref:Thioredoxin domain-containing protein n=1 Tax=Cichlidogyrus casuarinus TaxID=1844966 RepID=A0ABD2PNK5_9PLAT
MQVYVAKDELVFQLVLTLHPPFDQNLVKFRIIRSTERNSRILSTPKLVSCGFLFIYATWCPYSMASLPYMNALARLYPNINFYAIELDRYLLIKWSLRMFHVPKFKFFIEKNQVREYNGSDTDIDQMIEFVYSTIEQLPVFKPSLQDRDYIDSPISLKLQNPGKMRLVFVWCIFLLSIIHLTGYLKLNLLRAFVSLVKSLKKASHSIFTPRLLALQIPSSSPTHTDTN